MTTETARCVHATWNETEERWRAVPETYEPNVCICCAGPARAGEVVCRHCPLSEAEIKLRLVPNACAECGDPSGVYQRDGRWLCREHYRVYQPELV